MNDRVNLTVHTNNYSSSSSSFNVTQLTLTLNSTLDPPSSVTAYIGLLRTTLKPHVTNVSEFPSVIFVDPLLSPSISQEPTMTSSEDPEQQNNGEIPLWLPYVIFTIVLLSLIAVSFARFHVLRGYQYRNRQLADERTQQIKTKDNGQVTTGETQLHQHQQQQQQQQQANGTSTQVPAPPEYLTLFLEFSRDSAAAASCSYDVTTRSSRRPTRTRSDDFVVGGSSGGAAARRKTSRSGTGSENGVPLLSGTGRRSTTVDASTHAPRRSTTESGCSGGGGGGGGAGETRTGRSRSALAYTFNDNGSMVDVRCGGEERTNTFRLSQMTSNIAQSDVSGTCGTSATMRDEGRLERLERTQLLLEAERIVRKVGDDEERDGIGRWKAESLKHGGSDRRPETAGAKVERGRTRDDDVELQAWRGSMESLKRGGRLTKSGATMRDERWTTTALTQSSKFEIVDDVDEDAVVIVVSGDDYELAAATSTTAADRIVIEPDKLFVGYSQSTQRPRRQNWLMPIVVEPDDDDDFRSTSDRRRRWRQTSKQFRNSFDVGSTGSGWSGGLDHDTPSSPAVPAGLLFVRPKVGGTPDWRPTSSAEAAALEDRAGCTSMTLDWSAEEDVDDRSSRSDF